MIGILFACLVFLVKSGFSEADLQCPATGQVFYQHASSCSKFYECNNGVKAELDCIPGLFFNPATGYCDYPENANCVLEDIGGPVGECPPVNEALATLLAHSRDCAKYYICDTGVAYENDCPAGLNFNPKLKVCDYPNDAGCIVD